MKFRDIQKRAFFLLFLLLTSYSISFAAIRDLTGKMAGYALFIGMPNVAVLKDLTSQKTFTVQCLIASDKLGEAQKLLRDNQLSGYVTAVSFKNSPLPYVKNIFDVAIIGDQAVMTSLGVTKDEILRILTPEGVLLTGSSPTWIKEIKPASSGVSQTKHDVNIAAGRSFSDDSDLQLPFEMRWVNGPRWAQTLTQGLIAQVSAGGVEYMVTRLAMSNEYVGTHTGWETPLAPMKIVARNAFNGLILWEAPCDLTRTGQEPQKRVAADNNRFYCTNVNKVIGYNKYTGQKEIETPVYDGISFIGITGNSLLVGTSATLYGHSLTNGSLVWNYPLSNALKNWFEANGKIFLHLTANITVLNSQSGTLVYSKPVSELPGLIGILTTRNNILGILCESKFYAYSQSENKQLWSGDLSKNYGGIPSFRIYDNNIQVGLDVFSLTTGAKVTSYSKMANIYTKCQYPATTPKYIVDTRINVFSIDSTLQKSYPFTRTPCNSGVFIANGLIYGTPEDCVCNPNQIMANLAIGSSSKEATAADFTTVRQPIKGNGVSPTTSSSNSNDWPTTYGNQQRGLSTKAVGPTTLNLMNTKVVTNSPRDGAVSVSWRSSGTFGLTAPVVAGGIIHVADVEGGIVHAISETTYNTIWTFTAEGKISSAPTIEKGHCVFSSHDGYIYCLQADNGNLIWKNRVAPIEKRIPAFGLFESPWPVASGVAIVNDTVFGVGGHSSVGEGGFAVAAFKLSDGTMHYGTQLSGAASHNWGLADLLTVEGSTVWMRYFKIGKNASNYFTSNNDRIEGSRLGLLDYAVSFRMHNSWRSGMVTTVFERTGNDVTQVTHNGRIISFDESQVLVAGALKAKPFADDQQVELHARNSSTPIWTYPYGSGKSVLGAAMYSNACVIILGTYSVPMTVSSADVILLNRTDGTVVKTLKISDEPVFSGMALKDRKIYLSTRSGNLLTIGDGPGTATATPLLSRKQAAPGHCLYDIKGRRIESVLDNSSKVLTNSILIDVNQNKNVTKAIKIQK